MTGIIILMLFMMLIHGCHTYAAHRKSEDHESALIDAIVGSLEWGFAVWCISLVFLIIFIIIAASAGWVS